MRSHKREYRERHRSCALTFEESSVQVYSLRERLHDLDHIEKSCEKVTSDVQSCCHQKLQGAPLYCRNRRRRWQETTS